MRDNNVGKNFVNSINFYLTVYSSSIILTVHSPGMNRPPFVFQQEETHSHSEQPQLVISIPNEMEPYHSQSDESDDAKADKPGSSTNNKQNSSPHTQNQKVTNNLDPKVAKQQQEKLKTGPHSDANEKALEKFIAASGMGSELLVSDQPRKRKKSSTFQEKADLFHLQQAAQMKRNLFIEEAASPTIAKKGNFSFKPQIHPEYQPQNQHIRTQQLQHQQEHKASARVKEIPQARVEENQKKKVRRLPSLNQNKVGNPITIIHDSSAIILHSTETKPQPPMLENIEEQDILKSILQPIDSHEVFTFIRQQQCGINYIHPDYRIKGSDGSILISAKKQFCHINSHYNLITRLNNREVLLGTLRGNFGGTQFNLYSNLEGKQQRVATIINKFDCSCSATVRRLDLYLKIGHNNDLMFLKQSQRKNLHELFEEGYDTMVRKFTTKQPRWSHKSNSFCLNFGGKSKLPSTKNMILVPSNQPNSDSVRFCKTDTHCFHLDILHSFNLFTAMAMLLTSFDFKLLCQ